MRGKNIGGDKISQRTYDEGYQKGRYDAEHDKGYDPPGDAFTSIKPFNKDLEDRRKGYKEGYEDGK